MAFDLGGAAGGALAGAALGPLGVLGGAALGGFMGGGKGASLQDMRTAEQKRAIALLSQLGETGEAGGISLGQAYGGPLGFYEQGQQSLLGGSALENLLLGSPDIAKARETFTGLADTKFDPSDPRTGYGAFSRALAREGKASEDVLEREAAVTGNRFGTAIAGEKADLAARMQDIRGQKLAQLYQASQATQLAGAQGLTGIANQMADIAGLNINYDEMQRQIKNQEAFDKLNEFKRQRNEELARIDILQTEANRNPYMGISSIPGSPSPFSQITGSILGGIGERAGGAISDKIFGKQESSFDKLLALLGGK